MEAALAEHGRRIEDLERIVLTHQHIDHIGLAQILADRSGAEVCSLDVARAVAGRLRREHGARRRFAEAIMPRHGIPEDIRYALRAVSAQFRAWGARAQVTRTLRDGEDARVRRAHLDGPPPPRPLAVGHRLPRRAPPAS